MLMLFNWAIVPLWSQFTLPLLRDNQPSSTKDQFLTSEISGSEKDSLHFQMLQNFYYENDTTKSKLICSKIRAYCRKRYEEAKFPNGYSFYLYKYNIEKKINDIRGMGRTLSNMSHIQYRMGNFLESVFLSQEGRRMSEMVKDSVGLTSNLYNLAWAYCKLQRADEAITLIYTYRNIQAKIAKNKKYLILYFNSLAAFQNIQKEYRKARDHCDSSIFYACYHVDDKSYGIALSNKSNFYPDGSDENLEQRMGWIEEAIHINLKQADEEQLGSNLILLGKMFQTEGNYSEAINQYKKSLAHTLKIGDKVRNHMAYKGLAASYLALGKKLEALPFLQKEHELYQELFGVTEINRVFDIEKKYEAEKNKNTIQELAFSKNLSEMRAKNQKQSYLIIFIIFISVVIIALFYFYRLREKENYEKRILIEESKSKISQLEKQALSAQMNPHFIFNSLNAIKNFIINNEARAATQFINNFAILIRKTLDYSQLNTITLAEEIESLKLYMDIEKKRFNESFNYRLTLSDEIEEDKLHVPPFILQPLVENAIWHGLMHKKGEKSIFIDIFYSTDFLHIKIIDTGIGLEKAKEIKSKISNPQKSFGFDICRKRLAQQYGETSTVVMTNNESGGATASIQIARQKLIYG